MRGTLKTLGAAVALLAIATGTAGATPVCTDGYKGGPPLSVCNGRIFPEAANAIGYIQYTANPANGFAEYQHGVEYLAQKYPKYVSVFTLRDRYGKNAVSAGDDAIRPNEPGDSGDGRDIFVIKLTDHDVPDKGKGTLFFSLSVHGNERGGLEGGLRTAEDLAIAATSGGKIVDGIDNYTSTTGRKPEFHAYDVKDVLKDQVVYLVDFNLDGWAVGDIFHQPLTMPFARTNSMGTDINRQMPTIGRIDSSRNPLEESEAIAGERLMREVAAAGRGGRMEYGADVHGELTSQAYMDIMYPAGEFDSVKHRQLMAIAERTKSVIDATLYQGIINQIEELDGGNEPEGSGKDTTTGEASIPTKPAHWATVWDTLGYTDTGFIGDYLAADELGVTGMDYEIFLNHTVPDKAWTVALQENHINATRGIIKTAMAYALTQAKEFNKDTVRVDPKGRAGFVVNPDTVTDKDENGDGAKTAKRTSANGKPFTQVPYEVTNQKWFADTDRLMPKPFRRIASADVAASADTLDQVDSLVLADVAIPVDTKGRAVDKAAYARNVKAWVEKGGNLVLTDKALHFLGDLGIVEKGAVDDISVYQPFANLKDLKHPMTAGLRPNARQLVEAPVLGYEIGNEASPMTVVEPAAWAKAKGAVVGTTTGSTGEGTATDQVSVGEVKVGKGQIRIIGGALPMPTEENDHRYGLRNYAMTYTGLFMMENSIVHDVPELGNVVDVVAGPVRRCPGRRTVTLRLPRGLKAKPKAIRVSVAGKRVSAKVRRVKGRLQARFVLRSRSTRAVTIKVTRTTAKGRRTVVTRRLKVCR
jgi:hypothetical protein